MRYCKKPDCVNQRFAIQLEKLKAITRLQPFKQLWHFTIGFEKIKLEDFAKKKAQYELVLNKYFAKLRSKGFRIQAYKVLDISKGEYTHKAEIVERREFYKNHSKQSIDLMIARGHKKETFYKVLVKKQDTGWNGKYFLHYHFIAIPWASQKVAAVYKQMNIISKQIAAKTGTPFYFKSHGLKKKEALLSYMSMRACGMYKKREGKEKNYEVENIRVLKDLIKSGKFFFLSDIMNQHQYFKTFYGKRHISFVGDNYKCFGCNTHFALKEVRGVNEEGKKVCPDCGSVDVFKFLPKGSIIMENVTPKYPCECKTHGFLNREQVRFEDHYDIGDPPPDNLKLPIKTYENLKIDIVRPGQ